MLRRLLAGLGVRLRSVLARRQSRRGSAPAVLVAVPGPAVAGAGQAPVSIDLISRPSPYVQPDRTTCGSASLVMARMINHPEYARTLLDASGSEPAPELGAHFRADVLAMHELTNTARDETGHWQLPWPKGLGTHPWAVARRMDEPGGCGVAGTTYSVRIADPRRIDRHLDAIGTAVSAGHCVPVFVGDEVCPRHVVLALDADVDEVGFYEPSVGLRVSRLRAAIEDGTSELAGWNQVWLSVLPTGRR